jgi:hypothetical protein
MFIDNVLTFYIMMKLLNVLCMMYYIYIYIYIYMKLVGLII